MPWHASRETAENCTSLALENMSVHNLLQSVHKMESNLCSYKASQNLASIIASGSRSYFRMSHAACAKPLLDLSMADTVTLSSRPQSTRAPRNMEGPSFACAFRSRR